MNNEEMFDFVSPVTGEAATFHKALRNEGPSYFKDRAGKWFVTEPIEDLLNGFVDPSCQYRPTYSAEQITLGWNVVRSAIWRQTVKGLPSICVMVQGHYDSLISRTEDWEHEYTIVSFDACVADGQLGFEEKCLRTLENVDLFWTHKGRAVLTGHESIVERGGQRIAEFKPRAEVEDTGIVFGLSGNRAVLALQRLERRGWIQALWRGTQFEGWYLGPDGEIELDRRRVRGVHLNQAFFVRPWEPDRDDFFDDVRQQLIAKTGTAVEAVWDRPHNERIDERVMRLIRESAVVVAEIDKNFNVGYEVGYAHALGKEIVAIRREPNPWNPPPFDIATLHCHDYHDGDVEGLIDPLAEKLRVAIAAAKAKPY